MKVIIAIVVFFLLALTTSYFYLNRTLTSELSKSIPTISPIRKTKNLPSSQPVDYKATFAIFTNGLNRNFSSVMYHNLSKDVYIQAENPHIIHIKKEGVTWNEFFKTLPMKLTSQCLTTGTRQVFCTDNLSSLKFYINSEKVEDFLERTIQNNDSALITYGSESEEKIQEQLAQVQRLN